MNKKNLFLVDEKELNLKGISLRDKISIPTKRTITDAGQMIVPCAFARTGSQQYSGESLGLATKDMVEVFRDEADVFAEDSLITFRSAPVTDGHPKDSVGNPISVNSENSKYYQVGMLEGLPTRDEDLLTGTLIITDQKAIDTIEEGNVELSAGYTCDIEMRDDKYYQTNIRANHIAIVSKGRAGSSCSIADEEETLEETNDTIEGKDKPTTDLSEAEAMDRVASQEENETLMAEGELEWAKQYTEDAEAMLKAHQEVAKIARKLATKKSKQTTDSVETLSEDVNSIIVALDVADEKVVNLTNELKTLEDSIDSKVADRCDVILLASDLTDIKDFSKKSVSEIKRMVVDELLDIDMKEKSDSYIEARFDILCEDNTETSMSRLLKKQATVVDTKYINPVTKARNNMINKLKTRGNK